MKRLLYALPGNEALTAQLASELDADVGELEIRHFPDGEVYVRALTSPEGRRAILVATLARPDQVFLPLAFTADLLRDLGAVDVGLVAPYLAYMRQDQRFKPGEAITSVPFARMISKTVNWLVTVDPHLHRRQNLAEIYSIPALPVHAAASIGRWLNDNLDNIVLVGPDSESRQWVKAVADIAGAPFIVLEKIRRGDRDVEISVPDADRWRDRTPVLVDDIISTARTMIETVEHLKQADMKPAVCIGVHAVFTPGAFEELKKAAVADIVTCNSVPHASNIIDLSALIAAGIETLQIGTR